MNTRGRDQVVEEVGKNVVHTRLGLAKPGYGLKVFMMMHSARTYNKYFV